jgi:uncharacterized membrane protein
MKKRVATWLILIFAFCGLADSAYLTQHEVDGTPLQCNVQNLSGCNIVAQSSYSKLFGIPLAEYGLLFYGLLFVIAAIELWMIHRVARRSMQVIAAGGFLASVYFVAVQMFIINALCIYCTASALLTLFIFLSAFMLESMPRKTHHETVEVAPPLEPPSRFSMPPA